MLTAKEIKSTAFNLGADQCGIANAERFDGAPSGFHPRDVYSKCKSAVVFLKRMPADVINAENKHGMGIISLRHSAHNAGLGILGRNTLLINRELGNLVYIGAVLIDAAAEPDPIVDDFDCPPNCRLCLDACPVKALDGVTVIQKRCREYSTLEHARGWDIYTCSKCRQVCLYSTGTLI